MTEKIISKVFIDVKEAQKQLKKFKDSIEEVKNSFIVEVGAIGRNFLGIYAIKNVYIQVKQLGDLSNKFELPTEDISKFNNMLSMFGGDTETTVKTIGGLEQALVDLKTKGTGPLKDIGTQIGLSIQKADGSFKNSMEIIDELRNKFKTLNKSAQIKVVQQLGIDNTPTINMLKASDKEYQSMVIEANKMSVITEKQKNVVQDTVKILAAIKQSLVGIGATFLEILNPALICAKELLYKFNSLSDITKTIIIGITAAIPVIKTIVDLCSTIKAVVAAISLITSLIPFVSTITIIIGIIALLYAFRKPIIEMAEAFKEGFLKYFDIAFEKIKTFIDKIKDLKNKLKFWGKNTEESEEKSEEKTKKKHKEKLENDSQNENSISKSILKEKEISNNNNNYNSIANHNNRMSSNSNVIFNIYGGDIKNNLDQSKSFMSNFRTKETLTQSASGVY